MRETTAEHVGESLRRHRDFMRVHKDKTFEELSESVAVFEEYVGMSPEAAGAISARVHEVFPPELAPFVMTGLQIGILAARIAEEES
jgi:hypothetical protein